MRHASLPSVLLALVAFATGCGSESSGVINGNATVTGGEPIEDPYGDYPTENITFLDDLATNAEVTTELRELVFVDRIGREQKVEAFAKGRPIVLVITRGNTTPVCPFCSTQTANYIRRYDEFEKRNVEVLLAYPVAFERDRGRLVPFLADVRTRLDAAAHNVPFPILFDVELKAVDQLGIRKDLAKPATYVVDVEGRVRYAHVGRDITDRPSVTSILRELDALGSTPVPETEAEPTTMP